MSSLNFAVGLLPGETSRVTTMEEETVEATPKTGSEFEITSLTSTANIVMESIPKLTTSLLEGTLVN